MSQALNNDSNKQEKSSLDTFDDALQYSLSLIARRTYNSGTLAKKLAAQSNSELISQVIEYLVAKKLLDDLSLCKDTACMWVQKKPISRSKLYQKLLSYNFSTQDIQVSIVHLEELYGEKDLDCVGGIPMFQLYEIHHKVKQLSLWGVLALAAVKIMKFGSLVSTEKIISRLKLRGFSVDSILLEIIKDM